MKDISVVCNNVCRVLRPKFIGAEIRIIPHSDISPSIIASCSIVLFSVFIHYTKYPEFLPATGW